MIAIDPKTHELLGGQTTAPTSAKPPATSAASTHTLSSWSEAEGSASYLKLRSLTSFGSVLAFATCLLQSLRNRLLRQRRHHRIPLSRRMHPIRSQILIQPTTRIRHSRVVIQIHQPLLLTKRLQPRIQIPNRIRRLQPPLPRIIRRRRNRSDHHLDPVRLRQSPPSTAKLSIVISGVIGPVFPATSFVPARITTAAGCRSTTSCSKPHHHLRSRLPADPPVHIRLPRKELPYPARRPQPSVIESP